MNNSQNQMQFKILLLGDSGVGKTSLMSRFTEDKFQIDTKTTIGVEYRKKTIKLKGFDVNLLIWDTAGQERFRALTPSYYKGAIAAILIYDITKLQTFENIERVWIEQIKNNAQKDILITVVGNKADKNDERNVSQQSVQEYCGQNEYQLMETSAKENQNVDKLFQQIGQQLYDKYNKSSPHLRRKSTVALMSQYQFQSLRSSQIQKEDKKDSNKKCC